MTKTPGDLAQAKTYFDQCRHAPSSPEAIVERRLYEIKAMICRDEGNYVEAIKHLDTAIRIAQRANDSDLVLNCAAFKADSQLRVGEDAAARNTLEAVTRFVAAATPNMRWLYFRTAALCAGDPVAFGSYLKKAENECHLITDKSARIASQLGLRRIVIVRNNAMTAREKETKFTELLKQWQMAECKDAREIWALCANASCLRTGNPNQVREWTERGNLYPPGPSLQHHYTAWLKMQAETAKLNGETQYAEKLLQSASSLRQPGSQ